MLEVKVDATRAIVRISRLPENVRAELRPEVVSLTRAIADRVRANLSGAVLKLRSGRLLNSIKTDVVEDTKTLFGRVYSDGSVPYARIHEYGGTINHPGSDKFQAWLGSTGWVYTHKTRPHVIKMPERSYMRSALADMQDEIVARLTAAAHRGVAKS